MNKDYNNLFEYNEKNNTLLKFIEAIDYIPNEEEALLIYNENSELKKEFDILKNNPDLRYLFYAFPHDSKVIDCSLKNSIFSISLDLCNSFAKPLFNGRRVEQTTLKFNVKNMILFNNNDKDLIGKETSNYEVDIIDEGYYKFAFRLVENSDHSINEVVIFTFTNLEIFF